MTRATSHVATVDLTKLPAACFQGVTPAIIATCSKDGEPNATYLSQVFLVDRTHVALSRQFFNKTQKNVAENPQAHVQINDPVTFDAYELDLRFVRAETSGPMFDAMFVRIEAIASTTGMAGVFKLLAADVYEVLAVEKRDSFLVPSDSPLEHSLPPTDYRSELRALQVVSDRVNRAPSLDELLASVLEALEQEMGFEHSMVLLPDECQGRLFTVASRGYPPRESGIGAEVAMGKGFIGTVASQKRVLRISSVAEDVRYGRAIRGAALEHGLGDGLSAEIPLPGLPDAQSHLGIPLLVQDRLVGVLAVESKNALGFQEWHESFLGVVANQVAVALEHMIVDDPEEETAPPSSALAPSDGATARPVHTFRFYKNDDCVFVDGEYLIRNVPGRILWKLLRSYVDERRQDFTNRELRLDPGLGLPPIKDNLESRLILLRKRLEQKCPDVRLPQTGRGHFRLETDCRLELVET